jgi:uncharacterized protein DUF1259
MLAGSLNRISTLMLCVLMGCASVPPGAPSTQPAASFHDDSPKFWRGLTAPLHGNQATLDGCFAVTVPRDDIDLESEMGQIPTSAGIESRFYFYRCECGKVKVLGDFLACGYESDDVLDALRAGKFDIVSMSPILENARPTLVSIRFQAEGDGEDLVAALRAALDQTGKYRHGTTEPDN